MCDQYNTLAKETFIKVKIERSEFLAYGKETTTEQEAKTFIAQISEHHKQATHHCPAYRIGFSPTEIIFSSDDGEPSGTAGKPILGVIAKHHLTDITLLVIRYFGGKKLGIRGLIDAYSQAAELAMQTAGIITKTRYESLEIQIPYEKQGQTLYWLEKFQAIIIERLYTDQLTLVIQVPRSQKEALLTKLSATH